MEKKYKKQTDRDKRYHALLSEFKIELLKNSALEKQVIEQDLMIFNLQERLKIFTKRNPQGD